MPLSDEDKAIRATGVGASEAYRIALQKGAHKVWLRLVHPELVGDDKPTVRMRKGVIFESLAGDLYAERFGLPLERLHRPIPTMRHPEHPCVLATPDVIVRSAKGEPELLLEIKRPEFATDREGRVVWGPDGSDEFPLMYRIQTTIQMAVTGIRRAHLVALLGAEDDVRVYDVPWDVELADLVIGRIVAFWRDYVVTKTPPPADASLEATDAIAKLYPKNTGKTRPASGDPVVLFATGETLDGDTGLAKALAAVRAQKRALEERERLLVNAAKERTGELDGVDGCWSWKAPKNGGGTTSWKSVAQELGAPRELIAKHTSPAARTFRLLGQED